MLKFLCTSILAGVLTFSSLAMAETPVTTAAACKTLTGPTAQACAMCLAKEGASFTPSTGLCKGPPPKPNRK